MLKNQITRSVREIPLIIITKKGEHAYTPIRKGQTSALVLGSIPYTRIQEIKVLIILTKIPEKEKGIIKRCKRTT